MNARETTLSKAWKYVGSKLIAWLTLSHELIEINLFSFHSSGRGNISQEYIPEIYPQNNLALVS